MTNRSLAILLAALCSPLLANKALADTDDYTMWRYLNDVILVQEFAPYDPNTIKTLHGFPEFLEANSPTRSRALLQLGTSYHAMGDYGSAKSALVECARTLPYRDECIAMLRNSSVDESAITDTPTEWDFSSAHGFVIPWSNEGLARLIHEQDNERVQWQTQLDPNNLAELVVGFSGRGATVRGFTLRLETPESTALQFSVIDRSGSVWSTQMLPLASGEIHIMTMNFADDFSAPSRPGENPLDIGNIYRLTITDVTAKATIRRGTNDISLLDFMTH
jgi:hypothetical protein